MRTSRLSCVLYCIALFALATTAIAESECRLTSDQKMRAVKSFKALSPIFQDQRCLNCHGGVNPFVSNGDHPEVIDMKEAAKKFLGQAGAASAVIAIDAAGQAAELSGIREFAEGNGPFTDKDVIRAKALAPMLKECRRCHVDDWRIPESRNDFTGRSWKQICMHMKTSSLTNTPVDFLRHMQGDAQVLLGFQGLRGLLQPPRAEPPAMSFDTMARHANDWVDAMGAKFHPPAECGCEADGLALEVRHHIYTNPESGASKSGRTRFDGTAVFNVLLDEVAPGWYHKEAVIVRREMEVMNTPPAAWTCAGKAWRDERWQFSARLDEEKQTLLLRFGFVDEAEEASWTCKAKGHSFTDEVYVDIHSFLEDLTMPTTEGAVGRRQGQLPADQPDIRFVKQFESITVSLIDSPSNED